jgi:hypothetical protein
MKHILTVLLAVAVLAFAHPAQADGEETGGGRAPAGAFDTAGDCVQCIVAAAEVAATVAEPPLALPFLLQQAVGGSDGYAVTDTVRACVDCGSEVVTAVQDYAESPAAPVTPSTDVGPWGPYMPSMDPTYGALPMNTIRPAPETEAEGATELDRRPQSTVGENDVSGAPAGGGVVDLDGPAASGPLVFFGNGGGDGGYSARALR